MQFFYWDVKANKNVIFFRVHEGRGAVALFNKIFSGRQLHQGGTNLFAREDFIEFCCRESFQELWLYSFQNSAFIWWLAKHPIRFPSKETGPFTHRIGVWWHPEIMGREKPLVPAGSQIIIPRSSSPWPSHCTDRGIPIHMWLVAMSVNICHITAENRHADRNELLKTYFAYVGTLSQRRINKTGNRMSGVFNVSDNIIDIQIDGCRKVCN